MAMDQNEVARLIERAVEGAFQEVFEDAPPVHVMVKLSERLMAIRIDDDEHFHLVSLEDQT